MNDDVPARDLRLERAYSLVICTNFGEPQLPRGASLASEANS